MEFALGGVHETNYLNLKAGTIPDLAKLQRKFYANFIKSFGLSKKEWEAIAKRWSMSNEDLLALGKDIGDSL